MTGGGGRVQKVRPRRARVWRDAKDMQRRDIQRVAHGSIEHRDKLHPEPVLRVQGYLPDTATNRIQ
jgi:hypothetical protein